MAIQTPWTFRTRRFTHDATGCIPHRRQVARHGGHCVGHQVPRRSAGSHPPDRSLRVSSRPVVPVYSPTRDWRCLPGSHAATAEERTCAFQVQYRGESRPGSLDDLRWTVLIRYSAVPGHSGILSTIPLCRDQPQLLIVSAGWASGAPAMSGAAVATRYPVCVPTHPCYRAGVWYECRMLPRKGAQALSPAPDTPHARYAVLDRSAPRLSRTRAPALGRQVDTAHLRAWSTTDDQLVLFQTPQRTASSA